MHFWFNYFSIIRSEYMKIASVAQFKIFIFFYLSEMRVSWMVMYNIFLIFSRIEYACMSVLEHIRFDGVTKVNDFGQNVI